MVDGCYDCYFDPTTDAWDKMCDDDLTEIFHTRAGFMCDVYAWLYDQVGDETKTVMQDEIDIELQDYSQWNEVLGCNINLDFDLSKGGVISNTDTDNVDVSSDRNKMGFCVFVCLMTIIFGTDRF